MIKAKTKDTIFLGLSDENIKRLVSGQPIKFNTKNGLELEVNYDVIIFHGKTEEDMYKMMMDGISLDTTKIKFGESDENQSKEEKTEDPSQES